MKRIIALLTITALIASIEMLAIREGVETRYERRRRRFGRPLPRRRVIYSEPVTDEPVSASESEVTYEEPGYYRSGLGEAVSDTAHAAGDVVRSVLP